MSDNPNYEVKYVASEPDSVISTVCALASTQHEVDRFSDELIRAVKGGEVSAIQILIQFKAMEKVIERVTKETKQNALTEADLHPEKIFSVMGNDVEKAMTGVRYKYETSGDPNWLRLCKALELREQFLRSLQEPLTTVDPDSGEVVEILPPKKSGGPGLKISIK